MTTLPMTTSRIESMSVQEIRAALHSATKTLDTYAPGRGGTGALLLQTMIEASYAIVPPFANRPNRKHSQVFCESFWLQNPERKALMESFVAYTSQQKGHGDGRNFWEMLINTHRMRKQEAWCDANL